MTPTPYQKIKRAAAAGRGVKLTATECWQLMQDDAIAQVAEADEEACSKAEKSAPGVPASAARHCGNCADGVPGGPDQCSKCGREQSYSHWTPAEIAHEESLAAEQAQDMQRRADNDAEALDPDNKPEFGAGARVVIAPDVQPSNEPGAWTCKACGFRGFWRGGPHCTAGVKLPEGGRDE